MKTSPQPKVAASPLARVVFGLLGLFTLAFGILQLCSHSIRSFDGWLYVVMGLALLKDAIFYNSLGDVAYHVSAGKLVAILALCSTPPLALLLAYGNRPDWAPKLALLFIVCITLGPVILLRRYRCSNGRHQDEK